MESVSEVVKLFHHAAELMEAMAETKAWDFTVSELQFTYLMGLEKGAGGFDLAAVGDGSWKRELQKADDLLGRAALCSDGKELGGKFSPENGRSGRLDNYEAEANVRELMSCSTAMRNR